MKKEYVMPLMKVANIKAQSMICLSMSENPADSSDAQTKERDDDFWE